MYKLYQMLTIYSQQKQEKKRFDESWKESRKVILFA